MATKNLVPRNSGEGQLGTTGKAWGSGYFNDLYVTGAAGWIQLTGGAGGGGSSLWSQNGTKIFYNTNNVGIGTNNPAALLHVSGNQYQVQISGPDGQSKYIKINSSLGDNYIGFDETQNALMMLADNDAPVYIGQVGHQAIRVDKNGDRGSVVIGDDATRPAAGDEVLTVRNTGSSAGPTMTLQNNTSFGGDLGIRYEHVGIGGNSWIQGRYDSDSSFRLAFKDTADAVLGTNDIITFTTGGDVGIGTHSPSNKLEVRGDARVKTLGDNQIALYMTTPDHSFGLVAQSGKYSQLYAGGPVKYSADNDTFLSVSGDRITIGNQAAGLAEAENAPVGFTVMPTDAASPATVNLLSTGISFAGGNKDNLLNFVEQEYDNVSVYNKTRWTIGQVVTGLQSQPRDTGSYLVIGYKTGEGEMSLTGSDGVMVFTPSGSVEPARDLKHNFGSPEKRWGTGYFGASTIFLGDTALKIENGALSVVGGGGGSANISGSTGYLQDLYVNGTRVTGGGGAGSSLWSENGDKIYYNTDNVGIGTTNPAALLHVSGDQYQVQISGPDGQSKYIKINSSLGDNYIGFDETQNALMMLADNDAPVYIGQVGHQAIRVDKNGDRGSVVIGDDATRPAAGDEVLTVRNTGSSAGPTMTLQNNTSFGGDLGIRYEHVGIGGNSWIQGRYDSDSSFRLAFTGGQDAVLGTNDLFVLTTGGDLTIGNESASNDFIVSGSKVGIGLGSSLPEYNLHVSGTPNSLVSKFEGDVTIGGDSANNATLKVLHTGGLGGDFSDPDWEQAAILISGRDTQTAHEYITCGIDNNQITFGADSNFPNQWFSANISNTYGPLVLGGTLLYGAKTHYNNVRIANNSVLIGDAVDFTGNHTLHVSGGRSASGVLAKFEGDVTIGGDSANNASLVINHTGSMGTKDVANFKNAAILVSGNPDPSNPDHDDLLLAIDNNQIIFSGGGASGPYDGSLHNVHGALLLGGSLSYPPYTTYNNIKLSDNGINLGQASQFSGSYPVHISGGRSAGGVELRVEGDISVGDSLALGTGTPYGSAIIDCTSTTKAFLPPRMTETQRDAISSPIAGMVIYNTDTSVLNFHNGTTWGAV